MNQEKIGKFISRKRKERKLTQSDLAEKLGVSNRAVSKWENGLNMPDLSLFKPLCKILGISINEIMSGEEVKDEEYKEKLEENIINITEYHKNQSDILGYIILNVFGIICLIFGLAYHKSINNFSVLFELFGSVLIVIGFLKLTRSLKKVYRIIINTFVIIFLIIVLGLFDYINIAGENIPPKYYLFKTNIGRCTKYKKIVGIKEKYYSAGEDNPLIETEHDFYYINNNKLDLMFKAYNIDKKTFINEVCNNNMNDLELTQKYDNQQ